MTQTILTYHDDLQALDIQITIDVHENKQLFYRLECRNTGDTEWSPYLEEIFDSSVLPGIIVEPKDDGSLNLKR